MVAVLISLLLSQFTADVDKVDEHAFIFLMITGSNDFIKAEKEICVTFWTISIWISNVVYKNNCLQTNACNAFKHVSVHMLSML